MLARPPAIVSRCLYITKYGSRKIASSPGSMVLRMARKSAPETPEVMSTSPTSRPISLDRSARRRSRRGAIPWVWVYRLCPELIASMAACLACWGTSKSGRPIDRLIGSFIFAARSKTLRIPEASTPWARAEMYSSGRRIDAVGQAPPYKCRDSFDEASYFFFAAGAAALPAAGALPAAAGAAAPLPATAAAPLAGAPAAPLAGAAAAAPAAGAATSPGVPAAGGFGASSLAALATVALRWATLGRPKTLLASVHFSSSLSFSRRSARVSTLRWRISALAPFKLGSSDIWLPQNRI